MKMELPNRSNRVQIKSQTTKNDSMSDAAGNVVTLVSDVELVANYPNNDSNLFSIMEIKNEFAGNVQ